MRKAAEIATAFDPKDALNGRKSFFLVGIGGAGMSALARMLQHRGFRVRGTDSTRSPETDRLIEEGIDVRIGHSGDAIAADDALVVTDAIDLTISPEVKRAHELKIPMVRRSQALGWLLKGHKVIAVTGTHGKTTTTGMIGAGLRSAGMDPLIVVGASVPDFGGPVVEGKGEWAVVEACEAYDSFHDIDPNIVVLTNLELDHVDFHGSYENLVDSVSRFVDRLPKTGSLIYNILDKGANDVAKRNDGHHADIFSVAGWENALQHFDIHEDLSLPGEHNKANASAALAACHIAGADPKKAIEGITGFGGAERRLQVLQRGEVTVIDDYAHHPSEIEASIQAVRDRYSLSPRSKGEVPRSGDGGAHEQRNALRARKPGTATPQHRNTDSAQRSTLNAQRLIVVYQPHLYSRTAGLIDEFAKALSHADFVVMTDIYPAREDPIPGVSSARIAELLTVPHLYIPSRHLLPRKVAAIAKPGDVIVGMGAGNIAEFAPELIEELKRRPPTAISQQPTRRKVVVAFGGDSAEREVSLHSGREVASALKRKGHEVELIDFTDLLLARADLSKFKGASRPDAVFLAVHGTHSEDGAIQGFLEMMHIPYTGSGIQSSALAMNKDLTKTIVQSHGLKVPKGELLTKRDQPCSIQAPAVVKPNAQGSTVGLSFVEKQEDLKAAIEKAFSYDDAVLVEEWVRGMEISVPVLGGRALPPVEIAPKSGRYDFASKYLPGATEEIVPARLPEKTLKRAQEIALKAHQALGCEGATRTDMIVSEPYDKSEPVVLEVNTLPGMTATSLLPNSARADGISFEDLVEWILEDALRRHGTKV